MPESHREILSIEDLPENSRVEEVAQFMRQTPATVRRWVREGVFPHAMKMGRILLIPKQDVIDYIKMNYGNAVTKEKR